MHVIIIIVSITSTKLVLNYCFSFVLNSVIDLVESVAESLPLEGQTPATIVSENKGLAIGAIAPDVQNFQGVSFDVNFNNDGSIDSANPTASASSESETSISIPRTLLQDLNIDPATLTNVRVGFSVFTDDSLFQPRSRQETSDAMQSRSAITSSIISANVSGLDVEVKDLQNPVMIELTIKPVGYHKIS